MGVRKTDKVKPEDVPAREPRSCPTCGKTLPDWWKYDYCSETCEKAKDGQSEGS